MLVHRFSDIRITRKALDTMIKLPFNFIARPPSHQTRTDCYFCIFKCTLPQARARFRALHKLSTTLRFPVFFTRRLALPNDRPKVSCMAWLRVLIPQATSRYNRQTMRPWRLMTLRIRLNWRVPVLQTLPAATAESGPRNSSSSNFLPGLTWRAQRCARKARNHDKPCGWPAPQVVCANRSFGSVCCVKIHRLWRCFQKRLLNNFQ